MNANFHESYAGGEIKPPSERSTGLLFAVVAVIIAVLWRDSPAMLWGGLCIAPLLAATSLLAPALLRPINTLWFQVGLLLHRVVNTVVMFALFAAVFLPAGAIMRLWRDPLRSKRHALGASTYWVTREASSEGEGSMRNSF